MYLKKTITILLLLPLMGLNLLPIGSNICPMAGLDSADKPACCIVKSAAGVQYQSRCCCDYSERPEFPSESNIILTSKESAKRVLEQQGTLPAGTVEKPVDLTKTKFIRSGCSDCILHPHDIPVYDFVSSYLI
jgi:hypothetical protein